MAARSPCRPSTASCRSRAFADPLPLARNYDGTGKDWTRGDFDGDGTTGLSDLLARARNDGQSFAFAAFARLLEADQSTTTAPEPSIAATAVALGLFARRRRCGAPSN